MPGPASPHANVAEKKAVPSRHSFARAPSNSKDVLVSLYHFAHSWVMLETPRSFEDFFQQFLDGDGSTGTHFFSPTTYMGSWFDHVREYHEARDQLDIHFVQYENMLKKLEVILLMDETIDHVVEMSTFKNMKSNPKANYKDLTETNRNKKETVRKGIAGDWKNFFTVAQNEHFDKMLEEKMSDLPLTYTWEIKQ